MADRYGSAETVSGIPLGGDWLSILGPVCSPESAPGFGRRTLSVPATEWTSTGLYLKRGQRVAVSARGAWTIWAGVTAPFGPAGHPGLSMLHQCRKGALLGRLGLAGGVDGPGLCFGDGAEVTAPGDGILYLGMNDDASPRFHGGAIDVTVVSGGAVAPEVTAAQVAGTDFCAVASGWVELSSPSGHLLLTVPAPLAARDRSGITATLAMLDAWYEALASLMGGARPGGGAPIRFLPDFSVAPRGFMIAGNPVRFDPRLLNAVEPARTRLLLMAGDGPAARFDVARALGILFSRAGDESYQATDATAQAFGGLLAVYAGEATGMTVALPRDPCSAAGAGGVPLEDDAWGQLCFLMGEKDRLGWSGVRAALAGLAAGGADPGGNELPRFQPAWQKVVDTFRAVTPGG